MKLIKKIANTIYFLIVGLLVLITIITAFSVIKAPGNLRFFVVLSGSMSPKIKIGSIVLVLPKTEYHQGDVITFLSSPKADIKKPGSTITHRIFAVSNDEGRPTYTTKGDANEDPDREMVEANRVLGKVILSLPFLGYAVAFAKTPKGFITLVVIPATLIIYSELLNIKNELVRLIKERSKKSRSVKIVKPVKSVKSKKTKKTKKNK